MTSKGHEAPSCITVRKKEQNTTKWCECQAANVLGKKQTKTNHPYLKIHTSEQFISL